MTSKSREQVDKEIHIRRTGGKVPAGGLNHQRKVQNKLATKARTVAEVDKDAHRRAIGQKVAPRGRLSDAATGRLIGTKFNPGEHPRKRNGEFRKK